jgi:hypothetical protein
MKINHRQQVEDTTFKAPIAGMSLTQDPSNPQAWEKPPQITDVNEAILEAIHPLLTNEDKLYQFISLAEEGVPLEFFVNLITYQGFKKGKWNPDVMLLLMEPILYVLIAICLKADIEFNLDKDDMTKTLKDDTYRYSNDDEVKGEVEELEEKIEEEIQPSLLAQIREKV